MAGEWKKYLKDNVWYCLDECKWRFGEKRYRRQGQAVNAAFKTWRGIEK